ERAGAGPIAGGASMPTAAELHQALADCYRDGDLVYTNSSLPIREQERFLPPIAADVTFLANRGANGIDGLISSGIGAALATDRPTVIITGDVALLHDLGALAAVKLARAPVRILVINNGGGRIFDRLPQHDSLPPDEFRELMTTPPGIDFARAAALFGLPHSAITDLDRLPAALDAGTGLIEVAIPA
ncbi:MAG TPA: thiamine pyrophosphate-binding protein, partial [Solirubrobacterales bacterium]|nr:thiamine pyrophosphate-binding protein [Solirubrobacterales bacterium]